MIVSSELFLIITIRINLRYCYLLVLVSMTENNTKKYGEIVYK